MQTIKTAGMLAEESDNACGQQTRAAGRPPARVHAAPQPGVGRGEIIVMFSRKVRSRKISGLDLDLRERRATVEWMEARQTFQWENRCGRVHTQQGAAESGG
jgi:hypothetical protein